MYMFRNNHTMTLSPTLKLYNIARPSSSEKDDLAQTGNDQNQTGLCRSNTFNSGFQTSQQHSGVYRSSFHFRTDPTIDHLSPSTDTVRSLTVVLVLVVDRTCDWTDQSQNSHQTQSFTNNQDLPSFKGKVLSIYTLVMQI